MNLSSAERKRSSEKPYVVAAFIITIMIAGLWFGWMRDFVPLDWHAKKYSLGVFSKLEFPAFTLLAFAICSVFRSFLQAGLLLLLSFAVLYFTYFGAFEIVKDMGPDMYSNYVVAELGCFPDKWLPFLEVNELELSEHAQLCSSLKGRAE